MPPLVAMAQGDVRRFYYARPELNPYTARIPFLPGLHTEHVRAVAASVDTVTPDQLASLMKTYEGLLQYIYPDGKCTREARSHPAWLEPPPEVKELLGHRAQLKNRTGQHLADQR